MEHFDEALRRSLSGITVHGENKVETLVEQMKERHVVLLGEASHGTHEYYKVRSDITKMLVQDHGFRFLAVEGDWPSCFEVNEYIKGRSHDQTARAVLIRSFERWPRWMWVNEDVEELVEWLKGHNDPLPESEKVGFYGLDVYSLWESLDMLTQYFKDDPDSLAQIYRVYECFQPFGRNEQRYAQATPHLEQTCEDASVSLLNHMLQKRTYSGNEKYLTITINALVIKNAESYYRSMVRLDDGAWNIRDRHMNSVLEELRSYFGWAKAIVWEHNTHVGDARATHMAWSGLVNIGELARNRYGPEKVFIMGFGSYAGHVLAGSSWGSQEQVMEVPEARYGSWESILHAYGKGKDILLHFTPESRLDLALRAWRDHRAIGVVYNSDIESWNYVRTQLPERYDAFWFIDVTGALKPLASGWETEEPETYPTGI